MAGTLVEISPELRRTGRHAGYAIAVAVNLVMLIIVNNILDWGWLPFLTDHFTDVIPWINVSLILAIIANSVYSMEDRVAVKSTGQIIQNSVSVLVTYQIIRVFPFDFTNYDFNWGIVTRIVLILAMVGAGIGALAELAKLVSEAHGKERR